MISICKYISDICWYSKSSLSIDRIYACFINILVPHEVKNQRAIAKRTSQIMQIGQNVIIQLERCMKNSYWYRMDYIFFFHRWKIRTSSYHHYSHGYEYLIYAHSHFLGLNNVFLIKSQIVNFEKILYICMDVL